MPLWPKLKESKQAKKKQGQLDIRSSAAEYLTFVAATGDSQTSVEMRYEDETHSPVATSTSPLWLI